MSFKNDQRNCGFTVFTYYAVNHTVFLRLREPKRLPLGAAMPTAGYANANDGSMTNADNPGLGIWETLK